MNDLPQYEKRKQEHIKHALDPRAQASVGTGFDQVRLVHDALPNIRLEDIKLPKGTLYVSGMTAGHADAVTLNARIAQACVANGWAMGVGSQRRDLVGSDETAIYENWSRFRDQFPSLELFANVGITQLSQIRAEKLEKLLFEMNAQALVVHTNPLQEALQMEGTPDFRNAIGSLNSWVQWSKIPVVLKETGSGFSLHALRKLNEISPKTLHAVDVSGRGGTHWGRVEGLRSDAGSIAASMAETFSNWGESTLDSVLAFKEWNPTTTKLWVSGGMRSGLDAAKGIALGAERVGYAAPVMSAAIKGELALQQWMEQVAREFKIALFCTGCGSVDDLKQREGLWKIVTN